MTQLRKWNVSFFCLAVILFSAFQSVTADEPPRVYQNRLQLIKNPKPLLADHPTFVQPIEEVRRYAAPILVDEEGADLSVRAWRFSYNARGIIEMPNRLRADKTAVIMVHPWGIDDGQGWRTPEPAGVCDFCTPTKNHLAAQHTRTVIDPFLKQMRPQVSLVMFSLIAPVDPIRKKLYRTFDYQPTEEERAEAKEQLKARLDSLPYKGQPLIEKLTLSSDRPVIDYFRQFPGLMSGDQYNGAGFWNVPVPVTADVTVHKDDVLIFDQEGYAPLKKFLNKHGIRHILLTGYATDMCFCKTTAGYENLSKDFNVFLVGDATLATFPANSSPRYATNAHISFASINHLITQVSWIKKLDK
ncbi:Isochorismatase family protein [Gimesia maris]|uniref:isochorismatase family protein n=1 Tax=Gimesia maris TaxID=122 RepID=UPI00118CB8B7|nr:isochorismatase family protein [Gimesia maris]QDU12763.1 Isochorismatase family protein [Gimesia maris]